jgi:hypothetical protein
MFLMYFCIVFTQAYSNNKVTTCLLYSLLVRYEKNSLILLQNYLSFKFSKK